MANLVIVGAGGHARVAADIASLSGRFSIAGFIDDVHHERVGTTFCGASIMGDASELPRLARDGVRYGFVAIGDCAARMHLAARVVEAGLELAVLCHPRATIAADAGIGPGSLCAVGASVGPAARVGANVIVNTGASVDHECMIEDGVHIAPGARLGGRVRVGRGAWVGIGAVVKDGIRIGAGSLVGAGAVVVKDVPDAVVVYGNPARPARLASHAEADLD